MKDLPRLLNIPQVCDRLATSRASVYRLIAEGELEALKVRGGLRVTESSIEAYVRKQILRFQEENY